MMNNHISEKLNNISSSPGVYKFFDKSNNVIYIGKAKNLYKRVRSYFTGYKSDEKTRTLVSKINDVSIIIVKTETDALLLENNLIKKFKPKYNILLKDGKSYPWICVKNERFPRVFQTRKVIADGSDYYGPFTNKNTVNTLLQLIHTLFPIRISNYNLNENFINDKKNKLSLRVLNKNGHFILLGFEKEDKSFEGIITEKEYNDKILLVKNILKGNFFKAVSSLKKKMQSYSKKLEFEKANECKNKLIALENYQSKSMIISSKIKNLDVCTLISDDNYAFINYLQISNGYITSSFNTHLKKIKYSDDKRILEELISQIKVKFVSKSNELCSNLLIDTIDYKKVYKPKKGDKYDLLRMSLINLKNFKYTFYNNLTNKGGNTSTKRILLTLQRDLQMKNIPNHIECFDNSNLQGSYPSSACVVFKKGVPSKKDYRHFNIKTVKSPNDFASMEEVVHRRYLRLLNEKKQIPDLIIIDGGKGQLSSAYKSLKSLDIHDKIKIIGIAKRLEEIYFVGESLPIYIDKKSESLRIIQRLRDEAHRFSLRQYRNRRDNSFINSELDQIDGIGSATTIKLIKKFKSINNIKKQQIAELNRVVGKHKAEIIYNFFNK